MKKCEFSRQYQTRSLTQYESLQAYFERRDIRESIAFVLAALSIVCLLLLVPPRTLWVGIALLSLSGLFYVAHIVILLTGRQRKRLS